MATREPAPSAQFTRLLTRFPAPTVALAKRCMTKLRSELPGANQLVYEYSHAVVVSFTPTERGYEASVALSIQPEQVRLYFHKDLPDPAGLLEGRGSVVRSVAVADAKALGRGDLQGLLQAASAHCRSLATNESEPRMVIQSTKQKKASAKPAGKPAVKKAAKKKPAKQPAKKKPASQTRSR